MTTRWLVLAHATEARIYDITNRTADPNKILIKSFTHPEGRLKDGQLKSDKPGDFEKGDGGSQGKFVSAVSPHEEELHHFGKEIAHYLVDAHAKQTFSELIIAMNSHFYGIFKQHLPEKMRPCIKHYIDKNYLPLPETDVRDAVMHIQKEYF